MECLHCIGERQKGDIPFHIDRKGCHQNLDSFPVP